MFLSKLQVNVASRAFRTDYANIHDLHRTVMSAFPDLPKNTPARQEHGVLWRLDASPSGYTLYIQSQIHPDWATLPEGYLRDRAYVRCLQPVLAAIQPGRRFAFRIMANPTQAISPGDKPPAPRRPSKRVALHRPDDQINWLLRQGERHGFTIPHTGDHGPDIAPSPSPQLTGYKTATNARSGRHKITISPVRYDGHLIVTDPNALAAAVQHGIGRAKAYGCGLLSLAPPQTAP
ncbi:type I-E CRISPR-associated protein Cas6/Cse3/CasE [Saccharopolyspora phatthalungensis]|uniref:CRISPR system Cascade subunit CasE n=1 Tax=Saccharopolyspora phatthalungensis TaxID=664693 RepID=A0A840QFK5_9PSEU|nr:type I-E CRISPR-associated protein Cas6/Cse3/CasE [Saccharopolyspora phatthalungensis]MBB5157379.1 CRISPR system Cascade subunit CasE [Saccharopolyspora phatthalungensis]